MVPVLLIPLGACASAECAKGVTLQRGRKIIYRAVILSLLPALYFPDSVKAEDRKVAATPPPATLTKPSHWREEDQFYRDYIFPLDEGIQRDYRGRWDYHDQQVAYAPMEWRHEHLSIGSLDYYGRAPFEGDVRNQFAVQVLRMRIDATIRKYFATPERAPALKHVHESVRRITEKVGNYPVRISESRKDEFRMGYDVQSDSSKIEYLSGGITAGLYHPKLVTAMFGGYSLTGFSLAFSTPLGGILPSLSLGYAWSATDFSAGLNKPLSSTVNTSFSATYSAESFMMRTYSVQLSYSF